MNNNNATCFKEVFSHTGIRQFVGSVCLLFVVHANGASANQQTLGAAAVEQIKVLMAEKASRTPAQRKIESNLLYALKKRRGDTQLQALPDLRTNIEIDRDGGTIVDIKAKVEDTLVLRIVGLGGTIINKVPKYDAIRARLPLNKIEELASFSSVRSIKAAEAFITNMTNVSEGDVSHATDLARSNFPNADGSGVMIGVLSDSVDSLAALQASDDLPAVVTVLPGQSGNPGTSEGTAMLEIVHDLAPGSDLLFATAFGGQAQFAQNINDLAAAGARVIVDDIFYFAEAAFQDGIIAQAVNDFAADGGLYFSSAGNSGNLNDGTSGVWEGDFVSATPPAGLAAACSGPCDTADFGGGASLNEITGDTASFFTLRWSDPLGASANDYDLVLLNADGTSILATGVNVQDGDDDPFESISSQGFNDVGNTLAIIKNSAGAARCLNLSTNRGRLSLATDSQTTGHATAEFGFGVAAVNAATSAGVPFTGGASNPVETFSSDGPRQIIIDTMGNPITPGDFSCNGGETRAQPAISAADGVMTATPGFNPFFGTSAAAPHAAAIAALMQSVGDLNPIGARNLFASTALDIEAAGFDRDSGHGLLDGLNAVGAVSPTGSCDCGLATQACPNQLSFLGTPNNAPDPQTINQHLRACDSIVVQEGDFNGVSASAPTLTLANGFNSGDTSSWANSVP